MVYIDEHDYSFDYTLFAYSEALEQEKFNNSLNHMLDESAEILTESVGDTLKAFLDKITNAINGVWERFSKAMDDFATNNNKYLDKHKDVILNKEPLKATISAFNFYSIKDIKTADVPALDEAKLLTLPQDKEKFIKAIPEFSKFYIDTEKSFSDNVKFVLRGKKEPQDIKSSQLNKEQRQIMFDYVYNYNTNIKADINKSIDELKESNKKAYFIIKKLAKPTKDGNVKSTINKDNKTETKTADTVKPEDTNKSDNNQGQEKQESFTFGKTMSYYFNEMDIKEDPNQPQPEKQETGSTDTNSGEDNKKANAMKMYFSVSSELLGARLNIAQEAYKNYMRIIKWHVKKFVKDETPKEDTTNKDTENKEENTENKEEKK